MDFSFFLFSFALVGDDRKKTENNNNNKNMLNQPELSQTDRLTVKFCSLKRCVCTITNWIQLLPLLFCFYFDCGVEWCVFDCDANKWNRNEWNVKIKLTFIQVMHVFGNCGNSIRLVWRQEREREKRINNFLYLFYILYARSNTPIVSYVCICATYARSFDAEATVLSRAHNLTVRCMMLTSFEYTTVSHWTHPFVIHSHSFFVYL